MAKDKKKAEPLFHVHKYDYYGAPAQRCASNVTKEVAEKYAADQRAADIGKAYEVVPSDGK